MSLSFIGIALGALSAIAGAITIYYRVVLYRQAKTAGVNEAKLAAAEEEARRAKERTRIDEEVGKLSPTDLTDELHKHDRG